jgi:hypothetical protein
MKLVSCLPSEGGSHTSADSSIPSGPGAQGGCISIFGINPSVQDSTEITTGSIVTRLDFAQKPNNFLMVLQKSLKVHV